MSFVLLMTQKQCDVFSTRSVSSLTPSSLCCKYAVMQLLSLPLHLNHSRQKGWGGL